MKLAVRLPYHTPTVSGAEMTRIAVLAEQAGLHSGWVADHIVFPAGASHTQTTMTSDGKYPRPYDEPTLESLTSLAFVAGATTTLRLGVGVCVVPYRNPLVLAKALATLDILSAGRLLCGVGLGWLQEEFEALDVPFERRRARLVEGIALMRKCWSESPVTFHGQEYTVDPAVHFVPRPGRPIPLYMGGNSDAALRRAADSAQGWIGHELAPAECRTMRSRIAAIGPGSIDPGFEMISSRLMNLPGLGEGEQGRFTITSSAALAAELRRYEDAGLDLLLCETTVRSGAAYERLIEELHAAGAQAGMLVA